MPKPKQNQQSKPWLRIHTRLLVLRLKYTHHRLTELVKSSRLRLITNPDEPNALLPKTQLRIGRLLGRVLLSSERNAERLRIRRNQLKEERSSLSTAGSLISAQRGTLFLLIVIFVLGLVIDICLARYGGTALKLLPTGWQAAVLNNLKLPGAGTMTEILVATVAATATTLGLVLSISLIVFQATGEAYGSNRIISFLLRERVGSSIVRLLAFGFVYSLALLFAVQVFQNFTPYFSVALAATLSALGLLSLITYRVHALSGYIPERLFAQLVNEVQNQIIKAQDTHAGRSVQFRAGEIARQDLEAHKELLTRLAEKNDDDGMAKGIRTLQDLLDFYLRVRRRISDTSPWHPRVKELIRGRTASQIADNLTMQGLMAPSQDVPDRDWFENTVLGIIATLQSGLTSEQALSWSAVLELYANAMQLALASQEFDVLDKILQSIEQMIADQRVLAQPKLAQRLGEIAWILVEVAGKGFDITAKQIVDTKPWENTGWQRTMPRSLREECRALADKVKLELTISGSVITPYDQLIEEVERSWGSKQKEYRERYVQRGYNIARLLLRTTVASKLNEISPAAAQMVLRCLVRSVTYKFLPTIDSALIFDLDFAYGAASAPDDDDLKATLYAAIRKLSEEQKWKAATMLLGAATAAFYARDKRKGLKDVAAVELLLDLLFTVAYTYGWAEFHGHTETVDALEELVQLLFPLDSLNPLIGRNGLASTLLVPLDTSVRYNQWYQPLTRAAYNLPDVNLEIGDNHMFGTEKQHDSPLYKNFRMDFGPDEVVEYMVAKLNRLRSEHRTRLIEVMANHEALLNAAQTKKAAEPKEQEK